MTTIEAQQNRLRKIREMEKAGCVLAYHASTTTRECTLTVYWRGWQTSITCLDVFALSQAHTEWVEYRDSVTYRVMSHQDQPQRAERPQKRRKPAKRVRSRAGVPTPNVAQTVAQEQGVVSNSLSLRERMKLRNQQKGAA